MDLFFVDNQQSFFYNEKKNEFSIITTKYMCTKQSQEFGTKVQRNAATLVPFCFWGGEKNVEYKAVRKLV